MTATTRLQLAAWKRRATHRHQVLAALAPKVKAHPYRYRNAVARYTKLAAIADAKVRQLSVPVVPVVKRKPTLGELAWAALTPLLGIIERGGNNHGPDVERIIHANDGTAGEPWCGDTVAYAFRRAGSKVVQRAWAAVRLLGFLTGMRVVAASAARLGDIICFPWDHTGLFGWWADAHGHPVPQHQATHFVTREGNTSTSGAMQSDSRTGGDGLYQKLHPISHAAGARFVRVLR